MPDAKSTLSVAIIALNEEQNLRRCLASLPDGAEIILVDSGSTDRTVELAKSLGAKVITRPFVNYSEQKNFAISQCTRPWILSVDADEELDESLRQSIARAVAGSDQPAFRLRRQLVFMERRLRYGKAVDSPVRLFRRDAGAFAEAIHEEFRLHHGGAVRAVCPGTITHFSYKNIEDYFQRFNRYTTLIASQHYAKGRRRPNVFALALRPWFEFFGRYIFRLGFLDGFEGYVYALLSSHYAFVKHLKLYECFRTPRAKNE
jgi:glycosyltransferase involved in cell wall biosynthesis